MTPEIKAVRDEFVKASAELDDIVKSSSKEEIATHMTRLIMAHSALALVTIANLLDALCKEP